MNSAQLFLSLEAHEGQWAARPMKATKARVAQPGGTWGSGLPWVALVGARCQCGDTTPTSPSAPPVSPGWCLAPCTPSDHQRSPGADGGTSGFGIPLGIWERKRRWRALWGFIFCSAARFPHFSSLVSMPTVTHSGDGFCCARALPGPGGHCRWWQW